MTESSPDSWQEALTRRLRALLRTAPIHRLEASKSLREGDLSRHDLRALALRVLDATIDCMGLGGGASRELLLEALEPLIRGAEPELAPDRQVALANLVIDGLLNEKDRRQAFSEAYASLEQGLVVHRSLSFHLLREEELPDGSIVVRATPEGINLYTGMLEYDVEDAQAADEAVLRSQLNRGRLTQAIATARQARLRSIEYEQKLVTRLRDLERDITQVHWSRDELPLLHTSRLHIEERLKLEHELKDSIEQKLEGAQSESRRQLASLSSTLDDCIGRHLRLQNRLIDANDTFLREQEKQAFRPRQLTPLPHLEVDVLFPALEQPLREVAAAADQLLTWFQAPCAPPVFDLSLLADRLLAPRRGEGEQNVSLEAPELELLTGMATRFTPEDHLETERLLHALPADGLSLGTLLAQSRALEHTRSLRHLLVLQVLDAWDDRPGLPQVRSLGTPLSDPEFEGDDLLVLPGRAPKSEVLPPLTPAPKALVHPLSP